MAYSLPTQTAQIAIGSTDKSATLNGCQEVYLACDTDCYIDFDQPAVTSRSMHLKANLNPIRFVISGGSVQQVHVIGTTGTLYILGVIR
jgi:hypothetical protein